MWLTAGRLKRAAAALNLPFDAEDARTLADYVASLSDGLFRCKARLEENGLQMSHALLDALPAVLLHPEPVEAGYLCRFKTTRRQMLDQIWQQAAAQGAFGSLLFDRDGLLLEGARSNVFVRIGGRWHTPEAGLPLLNGLMRQTVPTRPQHYLNSDRIIESRLTREDVRQAEAVCLNNALRGLFAVRPAWEAV